MQPILEYLAGFVRDLFGDAAVKFVAALTGGVFLGSLDWLWVATKALFVLMCLDFGLGLWRAWLDSNVSTAKLRGGFGKFLLYLLAILAAHHVDQAAEPLVHVNFRAFLILYLAICESLSIFRHLCRFGVPIPKTLINRLETLRDCEIVPGKPKETK